MSETDPPDIPPTETAPEGIDPERLRKLHELRAEGRDPFAVERFPVTHHAADILARALTALENQTVSVAGRITMINEMGKAAFVKIMDASDTIQLVRPQGRDRRRRLFEDVKKRLDLGDIVGVTGFVFKTRTGEVSVHVREYTLLAKALRPMPFGKTYETEEGEEKSVRRGP